MTTQQIPANVLSSIAHARLYFNGEDFSAKKYREAKAAEARGVEVGATLCEQAAREAGISWSDLLELSKASTVNMKLPLSSIRRDGGTQSRVTLQPLTAQEYAEVIDKLPPVVVYYDFDPITMPEGNYWLADGFHRAKAHDLAGRTEIECEVRKGTQRDAILYSLSANENHGLRRNNADKRRAVETILRDKEWSREFKSDRAIAEACSVSHTFVQNIRKEAAGEAPNRGFTGDVAKPKKDAPERDNGDGGASEPRSELDFDEPTTTKPAAPAEPTNDADDDLGLFAQRFAIMRSSYADDLRKLAAYAKTAKERAEGSESKSVSEDLWNEINTGIAQVHKHVTAALSAMESQVPVVRCGLCDGAGCTKCTAGRVTVRVEQERAK